MTFKISNLGFKFALGLKVIFYCFPLFQISEIYNNEYETVENKNQTKNKFKPQHKLYEL